MKAYFAAAKMKMELFLTRYLDGKKKETQDVNEWGPDVMGRLSAFAIKGKMLRGGLIFLGYEMAGKKAGPDIVRAGTALELVQSSLLVHDDIIDRDVIRRGEPSFFYQYIKLGKKRRIRDSYHFGEGMGICAGDIGFFLANELITTMRIDPLLRLRVNEFWARELALVGLGQMQDLYYGVSPEKTKEEVILNLYLYKTARYTFSLPLMTGAILADASQNEIAKLERFGEVLGIIFQLKDDELGLFGDEKELGKPIGSDIKEGKKSLYYHHLMRMSTTKERKELLKIFGKSDVKKEKIAQVRFLVKKYGIDVLVEDMLQELGGRAVEIIRSFKTVTKYKDIFSELLDYSMKRKS